MEALTKLILTDIKPSLGVTEPGAIALAVCKARDCLSGDIARIDVALNSGMYKNALTCGIPGTAQTGAVYAAALGAVAGKSALGLEALRDVTPEDAAAAEELVRAGRVSVRMAEISPEIYIHAVVKTDAGEAETTIRHAHTNITSVRCNGLQVEGEPCAQAADAAQPAEIHRYTLRDMLAYVTRVPLAELSFLEQAFEMNLALLKAGLDDSRTILAHRLLAQNGGVLFSRSAQSTAQLLASGAIEARVLGISLPAMSITGSGSHGIIATMPLYALYRAEGRARGELFRATALSMLVTQYIKEYSGRLSALCGCGVAAGTGAACGIALMRGVDYAGLVSTLSGMTLGITGMICDGGNHGCAVKCAVAVDAAFRAADWAANGVSISARHGICGLTPEDTMRNIGSIASPGMLQTEKTILDIMCEKDASQGKKPPCCAE